MSYIIHFFGLVYYFDRGRDGKLALLPDGRYPDGNISRHYGSLFIRNRDIEDGGGWWKPTTNPVIAGHPYYVTEFPIRRPSQLTISGMESDGKPGCWPFGSRLDTGEHKRLPELKKFDNRLQIIPEWAETIAQMPVRQGRLESFLFGGPANGAGMSKLTVRDHSGPITILARLNSGAGFKVLKLKEGAEIILSNTSDLFLGAAAHHGDTHFRLYGRLDVHRRDDGLKVPPNVPELDPLKHNHGYFQYFDDHPGTAGEPGCSNTCC